jgi:N-acetylglucosaminyldiphosphoundecaprenol N-acetyl-beta-D-mannosaminyltransferase
MSVCSPWLAVRKVIVLGPGFDGPAVVSIRGYRLMGQRQSASVQRRAAGERAGVPKIELAGLTLSRLDEAQCIAHVIEAASAGVGGWVVTVNLDHLRRLRRDGGYRGLCAEASLWVADGMPLLWAARLQGTPLPERVAGSSMLAPLCGAAAREGLKVFLLGGAPGTAVAAARILTERYPDLRVVGTYCPPLGFERNARQWQKIERELTEPAPDLIFVGLGSPKQERLIEQFRHELPGAWWLGVGVSFSFLTGHVRRAPRWMQKLGVEWVHRLAQEPRRLAKRYLVEGLPFAGWLLLASAAERIHRPGKTLWARGEDRRQAPYPSKPPINADERG